MRKKNGSKNRFIVADKGWAETIPQWLLEEVKFERMAYGMGVLIKPELAGKVGDAEACAYLYTASLRGLVSGELAQVYTYLVAKLSQRKGRELPDFAKEKLEQGLTQDEQKELDELKEELYHKRGGEISHPLLDAMRSLKKRMEQKCSAQGG
jgi:hypothetical protein